MIRNTLPFFFCLTVLFAVDAFAQGTNSQLQEPVPAPEPAKRPDSNGQSMVIDDGPSNLPGTSSSSQHRSMIPPFRKNRKLEPFSSSDLGDGENVVGNLNPYVPRNPASGNRRLRPGVGGADPNSSGSGSSRDAENQRPRAMLPGTPRISHNQGVRTIKVKDGNRGITITEDPYRGITVEVKRKFTPNKHGELKQKLPDLAEYIEMFPNQLDSHRVELTVDVVSTYKGQTEEDLQKQNMGAYNIYRRYSKMADAKESKSQPQTGGINRRPDSGNGNSRVLK